MSPKHDFQAIEIPLAQNNAERSTSGRLYGAGDRAVILSNMNTNDQDEWEPLIGPLTERGWLVLTYDYIDPQADQWKILQGVIAYVRGLPAEKIVLIGASRGGVTSMQVLARSGRIDDLVGVAAVSSPVEHEGTVFFTAEELAGIRIPKLLINTEGDECAAGTRRMYDLAPAPKELVFYPGAAHGTEIFATEPAALIRRLVDFTAAAFGPAKPSAQVRG